MAKPEEMLGESSADDLRALLQSFDKTLGEAVGALIVLCTKIRVHPNPAFKKTMERRLRDARLKYCQLMEIEINDMLPARFCSLATSLEEEDPISWMKILREARVLKDRSERAKSTLNQLQQFWKTVEDAVQEQVQSDLPTKRSPNPAANHQLLSSVELLKSYSVSLTEVTVQLKEFWDQYMGCTRSNSLEVDRIDASCWDLEDVIKLFRLHSGDLCSNLKNSYPPIKELRAESRS